MIHFNFLLTEYYYKYSFTLTFVVIQQEFTKIFYASVVLNTFNTVKSTRVSYHQTDPPFDDKSLLLAFILIEDTTRK